jgi:hypothetical protein
MAEKEKTIKGLLDINSVKVLQEAIQERGFDAFMHSFGIDPDETSDQFFSRMEKNKDERKTVPFEEERKFQIDWGIDCETAPTEEEIGLAKEAAARFREKYGLAS